MVRPLLSFSSICVHPWCNIDSLAALSSAPSEAQISDPFAPEPTLPTTAAEIATASASASTTTTVTAVTAEVDLFGGQLVTSLFFHFPSRIPEITLELRYLKVCTLYNHMSEGLNTFKMFVHVCLSWLNLSTFSRLSFNGFQAGFDFPFLES